MDNALSGSRLERDAEANPDRKPARSYPLTTTRQSDILL